MRGGISYPELKALDVQEFFVMLTNYEEEVKKEAAAAKKQAKESDKKTQ